MKNDFKFLKYYYRDSNFLSKRLAKYRVYIAWILETIIIIISLRLLYLFFIFTIAASFAGKINYNGRYPLTGIINVIGLIAQQFIEWIKVKGFLL